MMKWIPRLFGLVSLTAALSSLGCAGRASIRNDGPPAAPCLLDEKEPPPHGDHTHPPATDPSAELEPGVAAVIRHDELEAHEHQGNTLVGIATYSQGAREHEVWRTQVAVGSQTPLHTHESEEIFVFLRGQGRAQIGSEVFEFTAPATVIAPAGVAHQFFNTGDVPTDAIVIVRPHSAINDASGKRLELPWRH